MVTLQTGQSSGDAVFGGAGSGVIISDDGLVLTNAHVIAGSTQLRVTLSDGRVFDAELVGSSPDDDIALIRLDGAQGLEPAELGSSDGAAVGDEVVAIGNALNLGGPPSVTRGIVSAKDRVIEAPNVTLRGLLQTDAAINPGNSGGPLLDVAGPGRSASTRPSSATPRTSASPSRSMPSGRSSPTSRPVGARSRRTPRSSGW